MALSGVDDTVVVSESHLGQIQVPPVDQGVQQVRKA